MYAALLGELAGCLLPFLTVRLIQTKGATVLVDNKGHPAFIIIGNNTAKIRVRFCKCCQTVLQIGIVRVDLHHGIGLVEIDLSVFIFFLQNGTLHKNSVILVFSIQVKTRKRRLNF